MKEQQLDLNQLFNPNKDVSILSVEEFIDFCEAKGDTIINNGSWDNSPVGEYLKSKDIHLSDAKDEIYNCCVSPDRGYTPGMLKEFVQDLKQITLVDYHGDEVGYGEYYYTLYDLLVTDDADNYTDIVRLYFQK